MSRTSFKITKEERLFYNSSFKQLADIQARQVGLLIGASVGDAAARAFDGFENLEEIAKFEQSDGELAFAPHSLGFSTIPHVGPLEHHSYSYEGFSAVVGNLNEAIDGDTTFGKAQKRMITISASFLGEDGQHAVNHEQLLHTACVLSAVPTIYPYADDEPLREVCSPLVAFLTQSPPRAEIEDASKLSEEELAAEQLEVEMQQNHTEMVAHSAMSYVSAPIRFLQYNPDPVKNAAFMSLPRGGAVFPRDVQAFLPEAAHEHLLGLREASKKAAESTAAGVAAPTMSACNAKYALPDWSNVRQDSAVLQSAMHIARTSNTFAEGVRQAIRQGGPTCQRSLLVGALLGAKLGVRDIPPEWIRATRDHTFIVPAAIEVAQWCWNPRTQI